MSSDILIVLIVVLNAVCLYQIWRIRTDILNLHLNLPGMDFPSRMTSLSKQSTEMERDLHQLMRELGHKYGDEGTKFENWSLQEKVNALYSMLSSLRRGIKELWNELYWWQEIHDPEAWEKFIIKKYGSRETYEEALYYAGNRKTDPLADKLEELGEFLKPRPKKTE